MANGGNREGDPVVRRLGDRVVRVDGRSLSPPLDSAFPLVLGGIDWTKVPGVIQRDAPPERAAGANLGLGTLDTRAYVQQVVSFFASCMSTVGAASDSWVAYSGDNTDAEYKVRLDAVGELLDELADVPEHKYVFALDASWCFMWSFEDDLYFGLRPPPRQRIVRPSRQRR
jgi:hypothetical protein